MPLSRAVEKVMDYSCLWFLPGNDTSKIPIMDVLRLSVVATACEQSIRSNTSVMVPQNSFHKDSLLQMPVWKDRPDVY